MAFFALIRYSSASFIFANLAAPLNVDVTSPLPLLFSSRRARTLSCPPLPLLDVVLGVEEDDDDGLDVVEAGVGRGRGAEDFLAEDPPPPPPKSASRFEAALRL